MAQQTTADDVTETPDWLPNYSGSHARVDDAVDALEEKYPSLTITSGAGRITIVKDGLVGHWIVDDLDDMGFRVNAANMETGQLHFEATSQ